MAISYPSKEFYYILLQKVDYFRSWHLAKSANMSYLCMGTTDKAINFWHF